MILATCFFITSFFNYLHCVISERFNKLQSLRLCISCLFSMILNDNIVDIGKHDGDDLSRLFLHQSVFSIKHLRSE